MTGLEWLNTMPYRHQVLFLKRLSETSPAELIRKGKPYSICEYLTRDFATFYEFLINSFTWSSTPEGHDYWGEMAVSHGIPDEYK